MNKTKVLVYGDSPTTTTGNAKLVRGILASLGNRDKYDLTLFALTANEPEFISLLSSAYITNQRLIPSFPNLNNDYWGIERFKCLLQVEEFDVVITVHDVWRFHDFRTFLNTIPQRPQWICYFPIDHAIRPAWIRFIQTIDYPVVYSQFALNEMKRVGINRRLYFKPPIFPEIYKPMGEGKRQELRDMYIKNDWPVIGFIGRNQIRKDPMSMLRSFREIYTEQAEVNLFMITHFQIGHYNMSNYIVDNNLKVSSLHPDKRWSDSDINEIINCFDMFVSTSIAEGLGYPIIEAQLVGIPVIVPLNSAMVELISNGQGIGIKMDSTNLEYLPLSEGRENIHVELPRVDQKDLIKKLLWAIDPINKQNLTKIGRQGREFALEYFSEKADWEELVDLAAEERRQFIAKITAPIKPRPWLIYKGLELHKDRILMICPTWGKNCGIAEYTAALLQANTELAQQNGDCNFQFDLYPHSLRNTKDQPNNLKTFYDYLERECPTIVHFQHEWGQYPHPLEMADAIKQIKQIGIKTALTLHTLSLDRTVNASLQDIDMVIAPSEAIAERLNRDSVTNTTIIPLGIHNFDMPEEEIVKLKIDLEISNYTPIIGSCGFIREQKGYYELVVAFKHILNVYSNALLLIHAPASFASWGDEEALFLAIESEQIEDHVAMIRSFLSTRDQVLLLSCCDILILPYRKTSRTIGYGTSAAARTCLAARRSLLVSDSEYFEDLQGEVFKIKNPNPQNIRMAIELMRRSKFAKEKMLQRQADYIAQCSWQETAKKHFEVYQQLLNKEKEANV